MTLSPKPAEKIGFRYQEDQGQRFDVHDLDRHARVATFYNEEDAKQYVIEHNACAPFANPAALGQAVEALRELIRADGALMRVGEGSPNRVDVENAVRGCFHNARAAVAALDAGAPKFALGDKALVVSDLAGVPDKIGVVTRVSPGPNGTECEVNGSWHWENTLGKVPQ